jgi:hypothetical protein
MARISAAREQAQTSSQSGRMISRYALLALGSFICALPLAILLLWKADLLVRYGLTGNFYFLILVPLGLAVASFLFGALRSFAHYRGRQFGGILELGGPVVVFLLVLILGIYLPPKSSNFPLTVYVHGDAGPQEMVLKSSGYVVLDLGGERRREPIGAKGQAYFPEIPASFRGQDVNVALDSDSFEPSSPNHKQSLNGTTLYLPVRKKAGRITGRVQDEEGKPLAGVSISIAGLSVYSDKTGQFEVTIPGDRMKSELSLQAIATNFAPYRTTVTAGGNEVGVILRRPP